MPDSTTEPPGARWLTSCGAILISGRARILAMIRSKGPALSKALEWKPGAVATVTGRRPKLSTSGGTSDARFIKDYCPVVEFGLVGKTMHMVDERVALADLETLTQIYLRFLEDWFG